MAWHDVPHGERSYRDLAERPDTDGPAGYRFGSEAQRALALILTELLTEVGERSAQGPGDVAKGAPRPEPVARIVPGDG